MGRAMLETACSFLDSFLILTARVLMQFSVPRRFLIETQNTEKGGGTPPMSSRNAHGSGESGLEGKVKLWHLVLPRSEHNGS